MFFFELVCSSSIARYKSLEEYRQRTAQLIQKEYAAKFNEWVEKRVKILAENNPKLSRDGKTFELYRLFNIRFPIT